MIARPSQPPALLPAPKTGPDIDLRALHPGATFVRIWGVNYVHLHLEDDGDLYLTEHGVPFVRQLAPANWYDGAWFKQHRQRLEGTGTVYRVPTRPIDTRPASINLVVKWSRVGQDVPLNTGTLDEQINAEFNSPFEEFALLQELRAAPIRPRILTQRPLAIYVPPERMQLWQTGRSRDKVLARVARHAAVEIDILRSYILLFGWVDGHDAVRVLRACCPTEADFRARLAALTLRAEQDLRQAGFTVADHKPVHLILRTTRDGGVRSRRRDRSPTYALVDYELLARTEPAEDRLRAARRTEYLRRQRDRFLPPDRRELPPGLSRCTVEGVDYVVGRCESTGGLLWVVGNDPELFHYFLPERWHCRQVRLSDTGQTYYAQTKDRIHVVWKVSRVGEMPPGDLADPTVRRRLVYGYNGPFEEFALALSAQRAGLRVVYPRAIYMTGAVGETRGVILDSRRFERMARAVDPYGNPVLLPDHDYVTIWGYWRGLEDDTAVEDVRLWNPIDVARARAIDLISAPEADRVMADHAATLAAAGFTDLDPRPDHVLLSYVSNGPIKRTDDGRIESRQGNLELFCRIPLTSGARR